MIPAAAGISTVAAGEAGPAPPARLASPEKLIVVGSSTGGPDAVREFLTRLPASSPGVLIVQHMPEAFTGMFAQRLNSQCRISVREARHGERVLPGCAYIAPGHSHLLLKRSGGSYFVELSRGAPVNHHRPSVDVLFHSVAAEAGSDAIGVILTGMGKDGAAGMLEMKKAGAYNFAQDEASCVVFGMPREAIALGCVDEVAPIRDLALRVMRQFGAAEPRAARA